MDSRRFLLAIILMIAVMVVTNILFPPPAPPERQATPADTTADTLRPAPPPAAGTPDTIAPAPVAAQPTGAPADSIIVQSPLYEYVVSTRGAAILNARLLRFESQRRGWQERPVELSPDSLPGMYSYRLLVGTRELDLDELSFTPSQTGAIRLAEGSGEQVLELTHQSADGIGITIAYTFHPDRYLIDARAVVSGIGEQSPALLIEMPRSIASHEANTEEDERFLAYVYNNDRAGIGTERLTSVRSEQVVGGPLHWVALKSKYFLAAVLTHPQSNQPLEGLIARPIVPKEPQAELTARLLPGSDRTFAYRLYAGPREPERLAALGNRFDDVNQFGWRPFRPILTPLGHAIQWALTGMHDLLRISYGWVLVLFGVVIRILLWPLNAKAMRSQMKNMEVQPKLKEIQAKYKNDPERLQKEMLRLYREEGFNPMGGCLPMLIPLPILITLFFVLQSTIAFRGVSWLWLPDLSQKDPLYILPILLGLSMYLMQWLSSQTMTEQNPQMKFMMYAMPAVMIVIFLNFASGLNLYYTAMNFASIPQQIQIMNERKRFNAARGR